MTDWSLTRRGDDLGGAPRWQIFLAKIAEGAAIALALALAAFRGVPTAAEAVPLVRLCVVVTVIMFIVSNRAGRYPAKPWHWACDGALQLLAPMLAAAVLLGRPWLALPMPALWLATYARGAE